jgi:murein DD-endopeptidase MepM/ murein hydrolase activator NlpD
MLRIIAREILTGSARLGFVTMRSGLQIRIVVMALGMCLPIAPLAPAATVATKSKGWTVRWQPTKLVNGAPLTFQVGAPQRLDALSGSWLGHDVYFWLDAASKTWYGIGGVSLETKAGTYALQLKGVAGSKEISFERRIAVGRAKYPTIAVVVPKKFTEPSAEQLRQINRDKTLKQDAFQHFDPHRKWTGVFQPPVTARVSDVFGTRRVFNGETKSIHEGLDYAVPAGTPVSALNSGTVILAQPLYFEGNCVVVDHGQGLLTLYLHLSAFEVKEGDRVERGQEIGLSGGTGRATGPHLHVAVRWEGVYLDPAALLRLRLP